MRAMLWEAAENGHVKCDVCAHACKIADGKSGLCGVRVNRGGELVSLVGDVVTSLQIDPMEKKPLYHFLPGKKVFSVGSAGCNFRCKFCQNHGIAEVTPRSNVTGRRLTPEMLVRLTEENRAPAIAFTYNEPTVFFELVYNTSAIAKANGLKTVLVSNGFMSSSTLQSLSRRIDAANIDLKAFNDDFYRHYCGGHLKPVLENLVAIKKMGWWLEVTTLLIPGVNDDPEEILKIARFIKNDLGTDTPWHISAFFGAHKMRNHPSTPVRTLEAAWQAGRDEGLEYVYTGNAPGALGSDTFCPECGMTLIERKSYQTKVFFKDGICSRCGREIAGIWS